MARPPHNPSGEQRKTARLLSGFGIHQEQIAAELAVSLPTLHKHYRDDLDAGMRQANARVVQNLFKKATGDTPQAVTAAIFWTKARMGWQDRIAHEVTGKDGGPIQMNIETAHDRIKRRIERLSAGLPLLPAATEMDVEDTEADSPA